MTRRQRRSPPNDSATPRSRPTPWEESGDGASSFGSWLRQQREMRHIGLREISDSTKIGIRYLEALEDNRFEVLPARVFAKGFLREYAKYVGLDPHDVVNYYLVAAEQGQEEEEETEESPPARSPGSGRQLLMLVGLLLLAVLAVTLVSFLAERRRQEVPSSPVAPPPIPTPRPAARETETSVEPPSAAPLQVTLDFSGECWVEIQADGEWQVSERRVQGESLQVEAEREVVLKTVGNPGAVEVEVNGVPMELPGEEGQVVRDVVIDLEAARLLGARAAETGTSEPGEGASPAPPTEGGEAPVDG